MGNGQNIQLSEQQRERLAELATEQGISPSEVLDQILLPAAENGHASNGGTQDILLDTEYHAYTQDHRDPSVDRDQVRRLFQGFLKASQIQSLQNVMSADGRVLH